MPIIEGVQVPIIKVDSQKKSCALFHKAMKLFHMNSTSYDRYSFIADLTFGDLYSHFYRSLLSLTS